MKHGPSSATRRSGRLATPQSASTTPATRRSLVSGPTRTGCRAPLWNGALTALWDWALRPRARPSAQPKSAEKSTLRRWRLATFLTLTTAATSLYGNFSLQAEAGYLYAAREGRAQYELMVGYQASGAIGISVIAVDSVTRRNSPELAVATVRWGSPGLALDIGRPGVSLGLTPPVFAGRRPSASRPSLDSTFARTALAAYGVPDYGAGLVGGTGSGLSYSAHAYTLQKQTLQTVALLALQAGVVDTQTVARPQVTPDCTICAVSAGASAAGVDASLLVDLAQQFGFVPAGATPETRIAFGDAGYHAGIYYTESDLRVAVDITAFDALGGTYVFTPAVEYSGDYGDVGAQMFALATRDGGTAGAHAWAVTDLGDEVVIYIRAGLFDGKTNAGEFAVGSIYRAGVVSLKLGVEYLDLDTAAGGGRRD